MKTTPEHITQRRLAHHAALETLKAPACNLSGLQIWRKLRQIEKIAHDGATAYCNGEAVFHQGQAFNFRRDETAWERFTALIRAQAGEVLGQIPTGFYVNGDARGHALKLDSETVTIPEGMETDWGRDGILAAEID